MALDVTQCASEKEKLQWAFRLYDVDASGSITLKEMENIIQTLDRVRIQIWIYIFNLDFVENKAALLNTCLLIPFLNNLIF